MKPARVAWHRRIAVRIALLIAASSLALAWLAPAFRAGAEWLIDMPPPETHFGVLHPDWIRHELMAGGTEPTAECVAELNGVLAVEHVAFLYLDPLGRILECTPDLPWGRGERWPHPLTETTHAVELGGETVLATRTRVFEGDRQLGTMVTIVVDEAAHRAWHESLDETPEDIARCCMCNIEQTPLVDEFEFELLAARREQIAAATTVAIAIAVALAMGFVVSWFVTRRITRLSEGIVATEGSGALPGPFAVGARDEIGVLTQSMNAMRARLLASDAERRDWIAQVSHDLRTPLTALVACLDRAIAPLAADSETAALLRTALHDTERIQSLAEDLLAIAKIDAEIEGVVEPVPPGELLRRVVERMRPWAEQAGLEVQVEIEPEMPQLAGDGERLTRALENLLRNAIQHAGGRIRAAVRTDDSNVEFEVVDDGPGFPSQNLDVGQDLSAGIGLVVVRRVADAHGGRCGAANLTPRGARVWFSIPAAGAEREWET